MFQAYNILISSPSPECQVGKERKLKKKGFVSNPVESTQK